MMKAMFWALGIVFIGLKAFKLIPEVSWFWIVLIFLLVAVASIIEWGVDYKKLRKYRDHIE